MDRIDNYLQLLVEPYLHSSLSQFGINNSLLLNKIILRSYYNLFQSVISM